MLSAALIKLKFKYCGCEAKSYFLCRSLEYIMPLNVNQIFIFSKLYNKRYFIVFCVLKMANVVI